MSCTDSHCIVNRQFFQLLVIPLCSYKAWTGCLTECNPEFCIGHIHHSLIQILNALYEMRLTQNEIHVIRLFYLNFLYLHFITMNICLSPF